MFGVFPNTLSQTCGGAKLPEATSPVRPHAKFDEVTNRAFAAVSRPLPTPPFPSCAVPLPCDTPKTGLCECSVWSGWGPDMTPLGGMWNEPLVAHRLLSRVRLPTDPFTARKVRIPSGVTNRQGDYLLSFACVGGGGGRERG
jgi:hypothetical protein